MNPLLLLHLHVMIATNYLNQWKGKLNAHIVAGFLYPTYYHRG